MPELVMEQSEPQEFHSFRNGYIDGEWQPNVKIAVSGNGIITDVSRDVQFADSDAVGGVVIPGMPNVHSHAFQWTFAGKSEFRTRDRDSFWSWREQMYESVNQLTPEEYYHRACELYRLMLRSGYTSVGEFHYIHNDEKGEPYAEPSILADQLIRAATDVGLAICMLPVLYQRGGFDDAPLKGTQNRFRLSDQQHLELCTAIDKKWREHPLVTVGMAFHSLRAVDPQKLPTIVDAFSDAIPGGPIHIHVAEQLKEVEDCRAATGKRPVELLLDIADVDERWCLIHATHLTDAETIDLAKTGAVVGLCPTTEANLGDGVFPSELFLRNGGRISIGSDSHVGVDPYGELRILEYGQRLTTNRRAVLCDETHSCGRFLYERSVAGGVQIMGTQSVGRIAVGQRADLVEFDDRHPTIAGSNPKEFFDRLVFCQWGRAIKRTMVGGKWASENGR